MRSLNTKLLKHCPEQEMGTNSTVHLMKKTLTPTVTGVDSFLSFTPVKKYFFYVITSDNKAVELQQEKLGL